MAPRDISQDRKDTPDPVEKGLASVSTLRYVVSKQQKSFRGRKVRKWVADCGFRIGVKAFVEKVSFTGVPCDYSFVFGETFIPKLRRISCFFCCSLRSSALMRLLLAVPVFHLPCLVVKWQNVAIKSLLLTHISGWREAEGRNLVHTDKKRPTQLLVSLQCPSLWITCD